MEKRFDVTALGELLIDFTDSGTGPQGNPLMEANPGGAPGNVLAMLSRLGHGCAFVGRVGDDMFGRQLKEAVSALGIDTSGITTDKYTNTTLAFVHNLPDGDREFSFYRRPGADMMLSPRHVDESLVESCRIFHFGTLSMTSQSGKQATVESVELARNSGNLVSFDPNIRELLWDDLDELRKCMKFGFSNCDILKISDNEIRWFTGEEDCGKAAGILKAEYGIPLILVSLGSSGSMAFSDTGYASHPAYKVNAVDTTGAGDCFCACVLSYVLKNGFKDYSPEELSEMLSLANAAAAIVAAKKGAMLSMPTEDEINTLLTNN